MVLNHASTWLYKNIRSSLASRDHLWGAQVTFLWQWLSFTQSPVWPRNVSWMSRPSWLYWTEMAALCPGVQYGLSSQQNFSDNKDLIFVKLTDSALRAIEDFIKNQVSTAEIRPPKPVSIVTICCLSTEIIVAIFRWLNNLISFYFLISPWFFFNQFIVYEHLFTDWTTFFL